MPSTKQIPWSRVLAEGAVIVISILLAFGIEAWWDGQSARRDERALLIQVRNTLSEDLQSVAQEADTIASVQRRLESLIRLLETGTEMDSASPEYRQAFTGFDRFVVVTIRYGPYETLKARGLDLITNQRLRVRLTSLYEDAFPRVVGNSEIDQRLSRDRFLPFMLEYLQLDENRNWVASERVREATSLGLSMARYRLFTLETHFLPSFRETLELMRETIDAIDSELEG